MIKKKTSLPFDMCKNRLWFKMFISKMLLSLGNRSPRYFILSFFSYAVRVYFELYQYILVYGTIMKFLSEL